MKNIEMEQRVLNVKSNEKINEKMNGLIGEEAAAAMTFLEEDGYEAYLVGGCVRDCLMGTAPDDVDITTSALPEETMRVFEGRGFKTFGTGLKHGTVTVLIRSVPLEITTYRIDGGYTDHRRPDSVSFTSNIEEDLARRDFTINALAWSPSRGFADAFGGREDLKAGILRCVGEPRQRFQEDALRILRALRFSSRLGFPIEEATKRAMRTEKKLLLDISAERIFSELKKLIAGEFAADVLLEFADILGVVLPEILPMVGFEQNNPHHIYDVWKHSVLVLENLNRNEDGAVPNDGLRLAALFHDVGKPASYTEDDKGIGHFYRHAPRGRDIAEEILTRLKSDTATKERVLTLIQYHDSLVGENRRSIKRWLSRLGEEQFRELLLLKRADNMAQNRERFDRQPQYRRIQRLTEELIAAGECFSLQSLAVGGADLMNEGIEQGPELGRILRLLLSAVINGEVENEREELLRFMKKELLLPGTERELEWKADHAAGTETGVECETVNMKRKAVE